jgi:hypothetical protein
MDPAVAPGGVLPGESKDDRHRAGGDARSTRAAGIGPFPPDQVPVPAEQGLGLQEEPSSTPAAEQSSQPGEQSTIRGSQSRSDNLSVKHGNLVRSMTTSITNSSPSRRLKRTNWRILVKAR